MFRILLGVIFFLLSGSALFAMDETYIGDSLGTNFYTKIDQGRHTIRTQVVEKRLSEWRDANDFVGSCLLGEEKIFRDGVRLSSEDIDALMDGDLTKMHDKISDTFLESGYTTDQLTRMRSCVLTKYNTIRTDTDSTLRNLETVAMIGLYMDGSTENSDYDIVSDIDRINQIIFETPEVYDGSANLGNLALSDILAGRGNSLFEEESSDTGAAFTETGSEADLSGSTSALICDENGNLLADDALQEDIANTLLSGNQNGRTTSGGLFANTTSPGKSSDSDFSHSFPCSSFFCIDVGFQTDSYSVLAGGASTSIEGIIKKNLEHIEYANSTSLTPKYMTNNFFGFTFPFFDLPSLANIVVTTSQKPQKFYTLAKDQKLDDERTFESQFRCARISAGLEEDEMKMNDFTSQIYEQTVGIDHLDGLTTDHAQDVIRSPSRIIDLGCDEEAALAGNADTYEGLSRDLTEIEVFTDSLTTGLHSTIPGVLEKLMNTDRI